MVFSYSSPHRPRKGLYHSAALLCSSSLLLSFTNLSLTCLHSSKTSGTSLLAQFLACQCREHGFDPWSGKIPHTAKQLSLCTTPAEPLWYHCWIPCSWSLCSATGKASAVRSPCTIMKSSPQSLQLEKVQAKQQRPTTIWKKQNKTKPTKNSKLWPWLTVFIL